MTASCPSCKIQFQQSCGYHPLPCPSLFTQTDTHPNADETMVIKDILCQCKATVGYQVIAGPKELLRKWKLNDELFNVDEKSLNKLIKNELFHLMKKYEASVQKISRSEGILLEAQKFIQASYQYVKNFQHK